MQERDCLSSNWGTMDDCVVFTWPRLLSTFHFSNLFGNEYCSV